MTTEERFLDYWKTIHPIKFISRQRAYRGNDPRNAQSDSDSFWYYVGNDGEHGGYCYFAGDGSEKRGSLYDICKELNIEISQKSDKAHIRPQNQNGRVGTHKKDKRAKSPAQPVAPSLAQPFTSSKRGYSGLADYCKQKNIPLEFVTRFGWSEGEHLNRPCIIMKHNDNGVGRRDRVRYLDEKGGFQPIGKWEGEKGLHRCFYGFGRAVDGAKGSKHKTIILTNGQSSVMVATFHGLCAFAQTDGETNTGLQKDLLKRLVKKVKREKLKIIIALDADTPGRDMANAVSAQLAREGIDAPIVDFGGHHGYDLADYCKQHTTHSFSNLQKLAELRAGKNNPVVTNDEMSIRLNNLLIGNGGIQGQIIRFPLKTIAAVGGMARYMVPKKKTYIIGKSGSGKTSMLETITDKLIRTGVMVFWWSPEWSPDEFKWRQIHRYGAANYEQFLEHIIGDNPFTPEQQRAIEKTSDMIDAYPGNVRVFQADEFTEDILERMINEAAILRRNNPDVKIVPIFDYAQRMKTLEERKSKSAYEVAMDLVKTFSERYSLHPIVSVQVEKSLRNKEILGMYDAQWVRPDYANLILTLNLRMKDDPTAPDGKSPIVLDTDVTGKPMERETFLMAVNVAKNSMGKNPIIEMPTDFERLAIHDRGINRKTIQ